MKHTLFFCLSFLSRNNKMLCHFISIFIFTLCLFKKNEQYLKTRQIILLPLFCITIRIPVIPGFPKTCMYIRVLLQILYILFIHVNCNLCFIVYEFLKQIHLWIFFICFFFFIVNFTLIWNARWMPTRQVEVGVVHPVLWFWQLLVHVSLVFSWYFVLIPFSYFH